MICGMKTYISRQSQPTAFNPYIFLIQPFSYMKDILSVQRHVRARGEITISNGIEMYNSPQNVSALQWWTFALRSRYGQFRHDMDIAVMFCGNANSEYASCIQS